MARNDDQHDNTPRNAASGEPHSSDRIWLEVAILASTPDAQERARREGNGDVLATVLVVAREPDMRAYVQGCLSGERLQVKTTPDLTSGVEALSGALPNLLIVHRSAQEATGSSRLAGPQLLAAFGEVPIILLVDEAPERHAGRPGDQTAAAILVAPFNARRLREEVERCLSGQRRE